MGTTLLAGEPGHDLSSTIGQISWIKTYLILTVVVLLNPGYLGEVIFALPGFTSILPVISESGTFHQGMVNFTICEGAIVCGKRSKHDLSPLKYLRCSLLQNFFCNSCHIEVAIN